MEEDMSCLFFFQAEDGIRDGTVTGVQTCALPILTDVLLTKSAKRGVDARMFDTKAVEKIGTKVKQPIHVKAGIEQEKAKSIVKLLKDSKMKVQASIQGTAVRVSGGKKDDLQAAIALVRKSVTDIPLQFQNFRD